MKRRSKRLPPLTVAKILRWADAHHRRTGKWPRVRSGAVANVAKQTWSGVDAALREARRSLAGKSSLAQLLAERRGVRNRKRLPRLTREQILCWAEDHFRRRGQWPTKRSGPVFAVPGEYWSAVHVCLLNGLRGLTGGSSLPRLLAEAGRRRNHKALGPLRLEQILSWARAHYQATGKWPDNRSGPVLEAPGESWWGIDDSLSRGRRTLPGGVRLAAVLRLYRNVLLRAHWRLPPRLRQAVVASPEEATARLVAQGFLKPSELIRMLQQRQRDFHARK